MGVYFEGIDTVGHLFMKYRPPKMEGMPEEYFTKYKRVMDEYYMYQDEILGEILHDLGPNTTVIVCSDHGFKSGDDRLKEFFSTDVRNAAKWHTMDGVIIITGPAIRKNTKIEGASVLDITPTILYLLGLPVARDMDGKVLKDAIVPDYLEKNEIQYINTYDTGDMDDEQTRVAQTEIDDSIKERLESLGYLGGGSSPSKSI
jgi:predicted AlkP superfamily phosphohydrolase/phosphomutase